MTISKVSRTIGSMAAWAAMAFGVTATGFSQDHENPSRDVRRIYPLAQAVSADRIEKDIRKLASFGTRHSLSDTKSDTRGIGAARRWIEAEMKAIASSCAADVDVFTVSGMRTGPRIPEPTEIVNVIALQKGILDPQRVAIMSGDIDSRNSDPLDGTGDAPGANDNASGMAGTIEALRVLCQTKFPGSIMYLGLSGEEQGLHGGAIVADWLKEHGYRVQGVLNNDMIGNIEGINGVIDNSVARVFSEGTRVVETEREARQRRFWGGEVDSPSRNLARLIDYMADQYLPDLDVMMVYRLDRFSRGGHHRPFNEAGWPGVRIMETNENYNRQHQNLRTENGIKYGDTIEGVNFDYARKLTALNVITLADLAGSPPFPVNVNLKGAVTADTTIEWEMPWDARQMANLRGFRIYWRLTTEPQWQWSDFVGPEVRSHTLKNIVIDNYFFGVSAVANDGLETPVVFPGPMGAFDTGPNSQE